MLKTSVVHNFVDHKFVYHILEEYHLGTKSNISRIKTALRDRELIDITQEGVFLEDPVFRMWLKKRY